MGELKNNNVIQLFEDKQIRTAWDAEREEWYFSIVDVISVLTGTDNPRRYWSDLKRKLKKEGAVELYDKIVQFKMTAPDGKKRLTDEWKNRGVKKGREYAILTDEITRAWAGITIRQYKQLKGLRKENLRDNMSDLELVLTMLAEASATDIVEDAAALPEQGQEPADNDKKKL